MKHICDLYNCILVCVYSQLTRVVLLHVFSVLYGNLKNVCFGTCCTIFNGQSWKAKSRGSFRKIVKRGLKVEGWKVWGGGGITRLVPSVCKFQEGARFWQGGTNALICSSNPNEALAKSSQVPSTQSHKDYMHVYTEAWQFWVLNFSKAF